jgi:mannonate dehydratase
MEQAVWHCDEIYPEKNLAIKSEVEMALTMTEAMRWYGADDSVPLQYICQAGASGVYTSLHHIPYGEIWQREEICKRRKEIERMGLHWVAVESVPVHEDIKTRTGKYELYIENYQKTIRHLGAEGIDLVVYNFMPVLDWVRTDLSYRLEDGSECLHFDPVRFAAFEIYFLERKGAEDNYSKEQLISAKNFFENLSEEDKQIFERSLIDVFPGCKMGLSIEDIRSMLDKYELIDRDRLKEHLRLFLEAIIPVAEKSGVRMAIHPDDPPYSILGLPRIVSCEDDIIDLLKMVDSSANGLCFCTGSYSPRADNDLPGMIERFGHRIHCVHLRSIQRNQDGSFFEADHLGGSVDMYQVVKSLINEMHERKRAGRKDWKLSFRPDHGHTMLDDLSKEAPRNPGYTAIGRLRGLAEIRGLQLGIGRSLFPEKN